MSSSGVKPLSDLVVDAAIGDRLPELLPEVVVPLADGRIGVLVPGLAQMAVQSLAPAIVQRVAFGGDSNTSYNSGNNWTRMLINLGRGRATHGGTFATAGFTVADWRDTHLPQVLATAGRDRPHAVSLMLGTNNALEDIATVIATYRDEVIKPLRAGGILPIVCTIPPRTDSAQTKAWVELYNVALGVMAASLQLPVLDVYGALVDPATGDWIAGFNSNGIDGSLPGGGIHFFVTKANITVAKYVRAAFLSALRGPGVRFARTNAGAANAVSNALMLTGGGKFNNVNGVAGFAQGWQTNTGLAIASGAPALFTDEYGSWQRFKDIDTTFINAQKLDVPITAGRRYQILLKVRPNGFGGDAAGFSAGASWYTSAAGAVVASAQGAPIGAGGAGRYYGDNLIDLAKDPTDFLVAVWEGVAPATATVLRFTISYEGNGATLVGKTLDYGSLSITDVT